MVSPALVPLLWALGVFALVSASLFFLLLRSGFELRRANLFLRFRVWEGYFVFVSSTLLVLIGVEFAYLALAPGALDVFPDAVVLLMVHAAAILVYLKLVLLLREGAGPSGREEG